MHEFVAWPKTSRLFRDIVVTEKLDGTNSAIHISALPHLDMDHYQRDDYPAHSWTLVVDGIRYVVSAQSRKRLIYPGETSDSYGFAGWVYENAEALVRLLGQGLHFGEWWGRGIRRGYALEDHPRPRRFSLFNTERYAETLALIGGVEVAPVPVLYQGTFSEGEITAALAILEKYGSRAAEGFPNPEGICIYHTQTRGVMKVTLDNNDAGKWEVVA